MLTRSIRRLLLPGLLPLLLFCAPQLQAFVAIDSGYQDRILNQELSVLPDPGQEYRVEQLIQPDTAKFFSPWHRPFLSFPAASGPVWLRIQLLNRTAEHQSLLLLAQSSDLKEYQIWAYQELSGLTLLKRERPNFNGIPLLGQSSYLSAVELPPYSAGIYYVRLEPMHYTALNLRLLSAEVAIPILSTQLWLSGLLTGVLGLLIAGNLIAWRRRQQPLFAVLGLVIALDLATKISWPNLMEAFSPVAQVFGGRLNQTLLIATLAAGIWFLRIYFHLPRTLPRLNQWLMLASWTLITTAGIGLLAPVGLSSLLLMTAILLVFLLAFSLAVWALPHQTVRAKQLLWSLLPIALMLLLAALNLLDLVALDPYSSGWLVQYLSALPWLILTSALARLSLPIPQVQHLPGPSTPQADTLMAELIARLAHDLKSPLSGVLGIASLLQNSPLSPKQQDLVRTLGTSGQDVLHQINQLVDLSRLESGQFRLESNRFELEPLLNDCLELFARRAEQQRTELAPLLAPDLPPMIGGDPKRILQILTSLLQQAFAKTHKGVVLFNVSLDQSHQQPTLRFTVQDSGPSLGSEAAHRQLECPLRELMQTDGIGLRLGLSLSYRLAEAMGGTLSYLPSGPSADPSQPRGNSFVFSLPLDPAWLNHQPASCRDFSHLRTLVVDDNPTCCKVLAQQCRSLGMDVQEAGDGVQALALLRTHAHLEEPIDLILLDYSMPNMDGLQLATRIHQDPLLSDHLVLVMLTGYSQTPSPEQIAQARISRVLTKPLPLHQLRNSLNELFAERLPEQSLPPQPRRLPRAAPRITAVPQPRRSHEVLVVDDNPRNIDLLIPLLQRQGIEPDRASNGQSATEQASRHAYKLVLMDCEMPIMDGFDATRRIRQIEEQEEREPACIIALGAHMLEEHHLRAQEAGMNGELEKPVEEEILERLLQELDLLSAPQRQAQPI